jgi:hypothetical protein
MVVDVFLNGQEDGKMHHDPLLATVSLIDNRRYD